VLHTCVLTGPETGEQQVRTALADAGLTVAPRYREDGLPPGEVSLLVESDQEEFELATSVVQPFGWRHWSHGVRVVAMPLGGSSRRSSSRSGACGTRSEMTPATVLLERLADARRAGRTFPEAWPDALAAGVAVAADPRERREWAKVLGEMVTTWRAAFERQVPSEPELALRIVAEARA